MCSAIELHLRSWKNAESVFPPAVARATLILLSAGRVREPRGPIEADNLELGMLVWCPCLSPCIHGLFVLNAASPEEAEAKHEQGRPA